MSLLQILVYISHIIPEQVFIVKLLSHQKIRRNVSELCNLLIAFDRFHFDGAHFTSKKVIRAKSLAKKITSATFIGGVRTKRREKNLS